MSRWKGLGFVSKFFALWSVLFIILFYGSYWCSAIFCRLNMYLVFVNAGCAVTSLSRLCPRGSMRRFAVTPSLRCLVGHFLPSITAWGLRSVMLLLAPLSDVTPFQLFMSSSTFFLLSIYYLAYDVLCLHIFFYLFSPLESSFLWIRVCISFSSESLVPRTMSSE